ncbi:MULTISPECIES: A24 family peptidase [unclassified Variovorax]|uniref:A24 family peptidase n=1 Tax=unclassified Variovorax TaxID=663243 RepID=UPI002574DBB8|nr:MULTISPECIES: A24 family peptidase [unclassified Variovorax]MDM0087701.1 A24 family peptidase [Variovorax sp. J22G40]MDM0144042.1 A24 family peptidase [Variovorax sp. J2P1-31]
MLYAWLLWLLLVTDQDLRNRRVPNWLVLIGAVLGSIALVSASQPFSIEGFDAVAGACAGFTFLLVFYVAGLMGAGDVKFAGALGLWVGLQPLLPIWIGASLLAGGHALLWMFLKRWPYFPRLTKAFSGELSLQHDDTEMRRRQRHIPFAAYLAIASVGWLVWRNHATF